eukprot:420159_1
MVQDTLDKYIKCLVEDIDNYFFAADDFGALASLAGTRIATVISDIACSGETYSPSSSSNPTNSPFEVSNFEPVININVTINSPNISTVAVSNNINESVNTYMNELTVNINYTLTADIINKREIFSQLYTNDSDREYIDVDE